MEEVFVKKKKRWKKYYFLFTKIKNHHGSENEF